MARKRRWRPAPVAAIAVLAVLVAAPPARADAKQEHKVKVATEVFNRLLQTPDRAVPKKLIEGVRCIAVIPGVIKGAFGVGGRHGRGIMSCRDDGGRWSPPSFVEISGGSFGFQIGAQSTDLVLFFMNERGVRSLLHSRFTLGGDASVAAGPVGRSAEVGTDLKLNAEIYSYARSRGFFAGLSLEGARLAPDRKSNRRYYGRHLWPEEILFEHQVQKVPAGAKALINALP